MSGRRAPTHTRRPPSASASAVGSGTINASSGSSGTPKRPTSALTAATNSLAASGQAAAAPLGSSIRIQKGPVEDFSGPLLLSSKAVPIKPRAAGGALGASGSFAASSYGRSDEQAGGSTNAHASIKASRPSSKADGGHAQPHAPTFDDGFSLVGSAVSVSTGARPSSAAKSRNAPTPSQSAYTATAAQFASPARSTASSVRSSAATHSTAQPSSTPQSPRRSVTFADGIAPPPDASNAAVYSGAHIDDEYDDGLTGALSGGADGSDAHLRYGDDVSLSDFQDDAVHSDVDEAAVRAALESQGKAGDFNPRALRGSAAVGMTQTLKKYMGAKKAREEQERNAERVQQLLQDKKRAIEVARAGEEDERRTAEKERVAEEKAREKKKEDRARSQRMDAIRELRQHREAKRAAAESAIAAEAAPTTARDREKSRADGDSEVDSVHSTSRDARQSRDASAALGEKGVRGSEHSAPAAAARNSRSERIARAAEERLGSRVLAEVTPESPAPASHRTAAKDAEQAKQSAWRAMSREFETARASAMSPTRSHIRAALATEMDEVDDGEGVPANRVLSRPSSRGGFFDGGRAVASSIVAMTEERRSMDRPAILDHRSLSVSPPPAFDREREGEFDAPALGTIKPVLGGASTKEDDRSSVSRGSSRDKSKSDGSMQRTGKSREDFLPTGVTTVADDTSTRAFLSATKLQNVMAYLDEVERTADDDALSVLSSQPRSTAGGLSVGQLRAHSRHHEPEPIDELDMMDTASHAGASAVYQGSDVQSTIVSQKLELDDKRKTIEMLRGALQAHRERSRAEQSEREKEERTRLQAQKGEYEGIVKRHLAFIDQLIGDKKALSERCEQLVEELKSCEKKFGARITALEESHARELKKTKEGIIAAEKIKREEWVNDRTKQIKEITIKGLEPEIQRMIAKHKQETKALGAKHADEMARQKDEMQRLHDRAIEDLRLRAESEREEALVKERDSQRSRAQKNVEQLESDWQQQRRRLMAERDAERADNDRKWREEKEKLDKMIEQLKEGMENAEETVRRRFAIELKDVRAAMEIEKSQWQDQMMHRNEQLVRQREQELRERLKKERDQEIEAVIARLEEETSGSATDLQKRHQSELKAVREKLEAELARAEKSERSISDKYIEARDKLAATEREALAVRQQLEELKGEHGDAKRQLNKLQSERDRMAEKIREEFADRLASYQEDVRRTRGDMEELRKAHAKELQEMQRAKEGELDALHGRVRAAMQKRDDAARTLREQLQEAELKVTHLEKMLEKQRRELLA